MLRVDAELVRDRDGEAGLVIAKYRLSTEQVLARLCSLCEAPVPAARAFVAQIVFAYVSGNGDAHAKNFSVLRDRTGRWAPAPAYDVPSSQPYGDNTMALAVDGTRDGNIARARWVALGVELGLPERAAQRTIDRVATAVDGWIDDLATLPFDAGRIAKLTKVVRSRQQKLLRGS